MSPPTVVVVEVPCPECGGENRAARRACRFCDHTGVVTKGNARVSLSRRQMRAAFAPYKVGDLIIGPVDHPRHGPGQAQGHVTSILETTPSDGQRWWGVMWRPVDSMHYNGPSIRAIVGVTGISESGLTRPGLLDLADPELAGVTPP